MSEKVNYNIFLWKLERFGLIIDRQIVTQKIIDLFGTQGPGW